MSRRLFREIVDNQIDYRVGKTMCSGGGSRIVLMIYGPLRMSNE